eukprot:1589649-Alexandrium_andersonii.AAC.1
MPSCITPLCFALLDTRSCWKRGEPVQTALSLPVGPCVLVRCADDGQRAGAAVPMINGQVATQTPAIT